MDKQELRKLLMAAKLLQISADIFAVFGIFLFAYIYNKEYRDNPFSALSDPFFIVTVLIPFIPAAVLAYMASSARRKVRTTLEQTAK